MLKVVTIAPCLLLLASCAKSNLRADADCKNGAMPITKAWGDAAPAREGASYSKLHVPEYPPQALTNRVAGTVFLHVWIQPDRNVSNVEVEQVYPQEAVALIAGLTDVVRSWKFNPVAIYGNPIASEVIVPVRFTVKDHSPPLINEPLHPLPKGISVLETIEVEGSPLTVLGSSK